ncbi:MAG: hypothetical protein QOK03_1481, partial [Candidatus Binataceae bacterium]|nr:hypothetical protein [Candidatus Binataceae bacterium]
FFRILLVRTGYFMMYAASENNPASNVWLMCLLVAASVIIDDVSTFA